MEGAKMVMITERKELFELNNGVRFLSKNIYNRIHYSSLLDGKLEKLRLFFRKKYNINYMGIQFLSNDLNYFISNLQMESWHMYAWIHGLPRVSTALNKFTSLQQGESCVMFLSQFRDSKNTDVRASIFGEFQEGLEIMLVNNKKNRILFGVTFKDHRSISNISYKVFKNIINDLKSFESCLDPFMDYFKYNENIQDSIGLKKIIDDSSKFEFEF
jgi:hypothetical protein